MYLLSHDRPTHEVLAVTRKDISQEYERGFVGMTTEPVELAELLATRETLAMELVSGMPDSHRELLAAVQLGAPDWGALPRVARACLLPAVRWKAANLDMLPAERRRSLVFAVENVFRPTLRTPRA